MSYIVPVDGLSDEDLEFYGFVKVHQGEEFSTYLNVRYNETQIVSNDAPRYIIVEDWNDAQYIARDREIIRGPRRPN